MRFGCRSVASTGQRRLDRGGPSEQCDYQNGPTRSRRREPHLSRLCGRFRLVRCGKQNSPPLPDAAAYLPRGRLLDQDAKGLTSPSRPNSKRRSRLVRLTSVSHGASVTGTTTDKAPCRSEHRRSTAAVARNDRKCVSSLSIARVHFAFRRAQAASHRAACRTARRAMQVPRATHRHGPR